MREQVGSLILATSFPPCSPILLHVPPIEYIHIDVEEGPRVGERHHIAPATALLPSQHLLILVVAQHREEGVRDDYPRGAGKTGVRVSPSREENAAELRHEVLGLVKAAELGLEVEGFMSRWE